MCHLELAVEAFSSKATEPSPHEFRSSTVAVARMVYNTIAFTSLLNGGRKQYEDLSCM